MLLESRVFFKSIERILHRTSAIVLNVKFSSLTTISEESFQLCCGTQMMVDEIRWEQDEPVKPTKKSS